MSANVFRSPLMQQIAAAARSQHRQPLVFSSHLSSRRSSSSTTENRAPSSPKTSRQASSLSTPTIDKFASKALSTGSASLESLPPLQPNSRFLSSQSESTDYLLFQSTIQSRRTPSNFKNPFDLITVPLLAESITRAIECGTYAPNHHRTEPTTYYRTVTKTMACDELLEICYNVTLCRNLKKKSIDEAHINAETKMNKWKDTIGGYIVVCVDDQPVQDDEYPYKKFSSKDEDFDYWYDTLPVRAPQTERQLEDYASASASIQNILLSIHSENYSAKWATGPMIRCRSTRALIGCKETDAIVGLIMIGDPKVDPRPWRKKREFDGDVMRDL